MRRSLKLSLLVPALICMSAAAGEFKPTCHKDKGKEPEKGRGSAAGGNMMGGPGATPVAGTPVTGGAPAVNPGAPVAVLPGAGVDNGSDNGSDNGTDGKVVASAKKSSAAKKRAAIAAAKRAELAKKMAERLGKYRLHALKKKGVSIDAMLAASSKQIEKPLPQTAFEEPVRAPASVATSYETQLKPASVGASASQ